SVAAASATVGFNTHKGKSKILQYNTACTNQITLDGEDFEDVKIFTYLGSIVGEHGGCYANVKARIGKASPAYLQKQYLSLVLPGIRNAMKADIGYTAAQLVYGTALRLPGDFMDHSCSSMNMDLCSYTSRLTNVMHSVKTLSTRPQSTDVSVQTGLRYSAHVFVRRNSHRRPLEQAYEGPFKVFQCDKNRTNDSISISYLKAVYLEGNLIHVDFPSVQSNHMTLTLIIPHPTTNTLDDTSTASENKLQTTRFERTVRFPEHLNDYCT
ncbi:unnamed protein product, partial [Schistosoma margrebowiei]